MGIAVPYRITRHAHPKARPESDLGALTPPAATGINYLDLVATAHQQHLAQIVNYAALTTTPASTDPAETAPAEAVADPADPADGALDAELALFAAYGQHLPAATTLDTDTVQDTDDNGPAVIEQIPGQLDLTDLLTTEAHADGTGEPATEADARPEDQS
jgi:hypothetical protein